jgi:hypothetical protein
MSVVIPAHNEEQVIARCLGALLTGVSEDELEVIVVCNGCNDETANIARRFDGVMVVELSVASKIAALREGDRRATVFPRIYLDADVELPPRSWRELIDALHRVPCAAPAPVFALADRPWSIRAFYSIWQQMPYLSGKPVGSGVYALSEAGRARFGEFPDLVADDQFVMQLFEDHERETIRSQTFVVHPPRTLSGLIQIRTRAYRGNRQLAASGLARTAPPSQGRAVSLIHLATTPSGLAAVLCYVYVNVAARLMSRRPTAGWERDESARRNVARTSS